MEAGSELSKTVAIFIVQKILLDDLGLQYICQTYERFYAVGTVLSSMVTTLAETQAVRLLKHVVRCYLRMSDNPRCVASSAWRVQGFELTRIERERHFELVYQKHSEIIPSPIYSEAISLRRNV